MAMRKSTITVLLGTSMLAFTAPAFAQDAAEEADASDIVVTGTRIVRDGYTAPTPVTVASTEDLVKSTPTNIPDALNKLPQFQNSLSPSKSASNFANLPIHGNMLNLRGLGTTGINPKGPLRTLVLFDGVRVAPTTYVGTVDSNVIPSMLVQRIDVVTGGASAAWGSDAVAGVVNFVLDKKYTGLKAVAQAGVSGRGDMGNQRLGAAFGTGFSDDRGHLLASVEYFNTSGLLRNQRKIGRGGYAYVGSTVGCTVPTGQPATLCTPGGALNPYTIAADVRIAAASEFGKIFATGNPFNNYNITSTGGLTPFVNGATTGSAGIQIGGDGYRIPDRTTAIKPYKTLQGFGRLDYDVADNVNVYAQALFSRTDLSYDALANSLVQGGTGTVQLFKGNPYIPAALNSSLADGGSFLVNAYYGSKQATLVKERTNYWQGTVGLDAELGGFKFAANYTHGESKHNMAQSGLWDWKKLFAAVDVVSVNGTPTCRVLTDATVASQYSGCLPLNLFAGGYLQDNQSAAYNWALGTSRYRAVSKMDSVAATLSGSLFELPAGPLDVVVGAEYRKQTLKLTTNADPASLDTAAEKTAYFAGLRGVQAASLYYWLTNVGTADGSLNVKEVFGEVAVPVLKDTPFFQELSLNGAVRLTDYSFSGSVTTWKAGATWKPINDLLLRGAYSRDIRAPNLYELARGDSSTISIVLDPVTGLNQNIPQLSGGNPNLKPEVARTLTLGGVLSPSFLPGFSFSVDYYKIKLKAAIDGLSAQQIVNNCANFGASTPECALITRPTPTSFPTLIRLTEANIAFINTSGFDFDASYRTAIGDQGALAIRLYANYLDKFDTQAFAGQPVIHFAGANVVGSNPVGYPHLRGSLSIDYTNGRYGVTLTEQYIGKMSRYLNGANYALSNFTDPGVGAVAYTDLSMRYTIPSGDHEFEFFGVVNNLFDKKPPLIPGVTPGVNLPTNFALYDIVGRAFTFGARVKF